MNKIKQIIYFVLMCIILNAISTITASAATYNINTEWFRQAKYGLLTDYFLGPSTFSTAANFNIKSFVDQIEQTGAGYVIFPLGQNNGYYCAPNSTFETIAGYAAGTRCSTRDIPLELYNELQTRGIKLMLYCTSAPPNNDRQACDAFNYYNTTGQNTEPSQQTQEKWERVIKEWSERYGKKVAGWWFDGCYYPQAYNDMSKAHNWSTFAAAAKSGNSETIVAFNPGTANAFAGKMTVYQDYLAGEQNQFAALPTSRWLDGMQWHVMSYLGTTWGNGTCRYTNDYVINYIKNCNSQGGVVTLDCGVFVSNGSMYTAQVNQLKEVKKAVIPLFRLKTFRYKDSDGNTVFSLAGNGKIFAETVVRNDSADIKNFVVIMGLYKSTELKKIAMQTFQASANADKSATIDIGSLPSDLNGYSVKTFIWNDFTNITSVSPLQLIN